MSAFVLNQVMTHSSEMPDAVGTDKYFVVVIVITILFVGISGFLFVMDKKLKKIESNQKVNQ